MKAFAIAIPAEAAGIEGIKPGVVTEVDVTQFRGVIDKALATAREEAQGKVAEAQAEVTALEEAEQAITRYL